MHVTDLFRLVQWQIVNLELQKGQVFNVGGGLENSISLAELTDYSRQITGNTFDIGNSPENRHGDLPIYITDNSKITEFSNWKPKIGIQELLLEIFDWFKKDEQFLKSILS